MSLTIPDRREECRIPYQVRLLSFPAARDFVTAHHYAKGMHSVGPLCAGLIDPAGDHLVGVIAFATPCSEKVRASILGEDRKASVTELHRLVLLDLTPPNSESWFIARALWLLAQEKPHIEAVVSFADSGHGHTGIIYQASNAYYYGSTPGQKAYLDPGGRLRHKRQCGKNITLAEAEARGWQAIPTGAKHRYCLLRPRDRRHARELRGELRIEQYEYPRPLGVTNGKELVQ